MQFKNTNKNVFPEFPSYCRCDHCGHDLDPRRDIYEYQEALHIRYQAGYGSRHVKEGSLVECVLCQDCTKQLLGRHLRIRQPHQNLRARKEIPWDQVVQLYYRLIEEFHAEEGGSDDKN